MQTISPTQPAAKTAIAAAGAFPWQPDAGDGSYRNPIIYADYSDPDVVRVGDDFFLVASSFNCTPGLPILHSKDLVNWTLINHALKNLPHPRYTEVQPGCGVWAPSIRFHDNKFWIFFPTPDEGIYVTTATHPSARWSEPHLLQAGKGLIDPCPLWDDDGQAYLVHAYAGSRAGIKHRLRVCPMAPDASQLLGEGKIVFHEPEKHPTLEGPKFLKRDDWYYILAPAGGVETGWQLALRSKNIYGPYEEKIVLEQGNTAINGPHQGALVDTVDGKWWFVHFQDAGIYGRVTHLQPVKWQDNWPMMGETRDGIAVPVPHHAKPAAGNGLLLIPQTSDEFDAPTLGLQWQWHTNHVDSWCEFGRRKSWLRLHPQFSAHEKLSHIPNLLLQKFPARAFTLETALDFSHAQVGEEAGLIVAGESSAVLALEKSAGGAQLILRTDTAKKVLQTGVPNIIRLLVTVEDAGRYTFSFSFVDGPIPVVETFQAKKGVWIGAKVGLYSVRRQKNPSAGHADFDYFRFK